MSRRCSDALFTDMTLQHGSSFVGLPILAVMLAHWYVKAPPGQDESEYLGATARIVWLLLIIGLPIAVLGHYLWQSRVESLWPVVRALYNGVTDGGFVFLTLFFDNTFLIT